MIAAFTSTKEITIHISQSHANLANIIMIFEKCHKTRKHFFTWHLCCDISSELNGQKMALSLFSKNFNRNLVNRPNSGITLFKRYCAAQNAVQKTTEYDEKVEYPPMKKLNTIEEKLIKVNMPAYWGLRTTPLENDEYH